VQKWGSYLSHAPFIIKTDQKSIKHMLDQKLNTPFQQVWVAKLLGFDFVIQYKEGSSNVAADALSRKEGAELLALMLSNASDDLLNSIICHWQQDASLKNIIQDLQHNPNSHPKFSWVREELRRNGKLVIGSNSAIKETILNWLHSSPVGGHSGRDVTSSRIKSLFYWKGMTKDIFNFVKNCGICQKNKSDLSAYPGLLQPLPVPNQIWTHISMEICRRPPNIRW
jgi:hypothetical protein